MKRYPVRPEWRLQAQERELALAKRGAKNMESLQLRTRTLSRLTVGMIVQIQNQVGNHPTRWDNTGVVVEVKEHNQYVVKVHGTGRLTLRNRQFLRHISVGMEQTSIEPVNVPLHVPDMVQGLPVPNGQEFRHTPEQDEAMATPPGSIHLREDTSSQDVQVPVRRSTRRQATIERLQPRWGVSLNSTLERVEYDGCHCGTV